MAFDISKNTLDEALSPYLRHHSGNPIHWQEWSPEAIEFAVENNRPILVSVGYSTCHWCHVMAAGAFSDEAIAGFLNENFVAIKVDREERPDIDMRMMNACMAMNGNGGWPLNVFLTPDLEPFFAMTYGPVEPGYGMPGFLTILRRIRDFYRRGDAPRVKFPPMRHEPPDTDFRSLEAVYRASFDSVHAGFGKGQKFPPHCALLFMLLFEEEFPGGHVKDMAESTLDRMIGSGLCDHLQGGFFRYSVDREWRIPHFEKMLYDQAMHLWIYSVAYGKFGHHRYENTVRDVNRCLEENFRTGDLYSSALDADTEGREGLTYLWAHDELIEILGSQDFEILADHYVIEKAGNFEGLIHLIPRAEPGSPELTTIEERLLDVRRKKAQPFRDEKTIVAWNCLTGIGLVNASRYLASGEYLERALKIKEAVYDIHYRNRGLTRCSLDGRPTRGRYLEDHASLLLFLTYLQEERGGCSDEMKYMVLEVLKFRTGDVWIESFNNELGNIEARFFDHPLPSSVGLAELALARVNVLSGGDYLGEKKFKKATNHDFYNISAMLAKGLVHVISGPDRPDWRDVPLASIYRKAREATLCYRGACRPL